MTKRNMENKYLTKLSLEQKTSIIEEYKSGTSCPSLSKKYNCNQSSINDFLKEQNVPRRKVGTTNRKNFANSDYFQTIDTQEKAYFLGLLYADGYLKERTNGFAILLKEEDREILDKFKTHIEYTGKLYFVNMSKYNENNSNCYRLEISDKKLFEDLQKLGCMARKSLVLKFPTHEQVPDMFLHHFIRGYFDGDGWFGVTNNEQYSPRFSLLGTRDFCTHISDLFYHLFGIKAKLYKHPKHNQNTLTYQVNGRHQVENIMKYLYKDATVYLERKHNAFMTYLKTHYNTKGS